MGNKDLPLLRISTFVTESISNVLEPEPLSILVILTPSPYEDPKIVPPFSGSI